MRVVSPFGSVWLVKICVAFTCSQSNYIIPLPYHTYLYSHILEILMLNKIFIFWQSQSIQTLIHEAYSKYGDKISTERIEELRNKHRQITVHQFEIDAENSIVKSLKENGWASQQFFYFDSVIYNTISVSYRAGILPRRNCICCWLWFVKKKWISEGVAPRAPNGRNRPRRPLNCSNLMNILMIWRNDRTFWEIHSIDMTHTRRRSRHSVSCLWSSPFGANVKMSIWLKNYSGWVQIPRIATTSYYWTIAIIRIDYS